MAKNISLAGAVFPDVPSVLLPQQGGGMVSYVDVTGTTATASDVAQGKKFYAADGTETTGTASGGGGGMPIIGALRPDAELVQQYKGDFLLVQDQGVTLPSYTTSATTVLAAVSLGSVTTSMSSYRYLVTARTLCNPIYNTTTKGAGRAEYHVCAYVAEWPYISNNTPMGVGNISGSLSVGSIASNKYFLTYWNSTSLKAATQNYGCYMSGPAPSFTSTSIGVKRPVVSMRGNSSYYSSTYWSYTTDIRCQYVVEIWRAPNTTVTGFADESLMHKVIDDINNNNGTLT